MITLVARIAWRFLRSPQRDGFISVISWFSVIGIFLGVATLIIVLSVMNGFRKELIGKIVGVHGHINIRGDPYALPNDGSLEKFFGNITAIKKAIPFVEGQAMLTANGFSQGSLLTGVDPTDLSLLEQFNLSPQAFEAFAKGEGILLGSKLAEKLALFPSQAVTFISSQTSTTAFGRIPRSKTFKVVGSFSVGMYRIDSSLALLPLENAATLFRIPDHISGYKIDIDEPDNASAVARQLERDIDSPHQIRISSWQSSNATLNAALTTERNVMFIILTLIILVAAFNIISGQIMLVRDKSRGIAILKTMGMSPFAMLSVFLVVGSSLGFIGTLLGCVGGNLFAYHLEDIRIYLQNIFGLRLFQEEIYFLSRLPSEPNFFDTLLVATSAFTLTFLASIYPAWRAMKLEPVAILRDQ